MQSISPLWMLDNYDSDDDDNDDDDDDVGANDLPDCLITLVL